jgi:hypothetical protein
MAGGCSRFRVLSSQFVLTFDAESLEQRTEREHDPGTEHLEE